MNRVEFAAATSHGSSSSATVLTAGSRTPADLMDDVRSKHILDGMERKTHEAPMLCCAACILTLPLGLGVGRGLLTLSHGVPRVPTAVTVRRTRPLTSRQFRDQVRPMRLGSSHIALRGYARWRVANALPTTN